MLATSIGIQTHWKEECNIMMSSSEEVLNGCYFWTIEADYLYAQGKYDEAIGFYDRAIKASPKDAELWNSRGLALCHLGRYKEAIESFDKVLEIDPEAAEAWNNKGDASGKLGRYD